MSINRSTTIILNNSDSIVLKTDSDEELTKSQLWTQTITALISNANVGQWGKEGDDAFYTSILVELARSARETDELLGHNRLRKQPVADVLREALDLYEREGI